MCVCVRLKGVLTSVSQEHLPKSDNAAFFQILISFFIQSEVVFLIGSFSTALLLFHLQCRNHTLVVTWFGVLTVH